MYHVTNTSNDRVGVNEHWFMILPGYDSAGHRGKRRVGGPRSMSNCGGGGPEK